MTFRVGQRVVCVDDSPAKDPRRCPKSYWMPHYPVRGTVYTLRAVDGHKGVLLEEIINPERGPWANGNFGEGYWDPNRFRPVKETNIDVFTAMLAPTPKQKVEA